MRSRSASMRAWSMLATSAETANDMSASFSFPASCNPTASMIMLKPARSAGVTLDVATAILEGGTPYESLLSSLTVEAAFDTESYNNGAGIVPSFLLVPYVITKDNLQLLVDTGLYTWDGDYLAAA